MSPPTIDIVAWAPQPGPQHAAFWCPAFEVFYGGARGGGKTDWALGLMGYRAQLYGAHMRGLFVRRTVKQLEDAIRRAKEIYFPMNATWREQGHRFTFPDGATVTMAYLERDDDAENYQGWSLTDVSVEELGNFPDPAPVLKLMATLRSAEGVPVQFRATGNPGGPGQHWIKQRYISPAPLGMAPIPYEILDPFTGTPITRERIYIPAKLSDNPILLNNDPGYVANLAMQASPQLVRAWLQGDWDAIVGAFFPEFAAERHIIPDMALPGHWTRFMAMDWGSARPFAVLWFAVSDGEIDQFPRGALIVEREWYGMQPNQPNTGLKLPVEDVARGVVDREERAGLPEPRYRVADPAMFAQDGGPSMAERMYRATDGRVNLVRADNTRVPQRGAMGGWDQVRARLRGDTDGRAMLIIMARCTELIRTLPAMQHDENRLEDLDTEGEDHACFAAGTIVDGLGPIERVGVLTRPVAQCVRLTFSTVRDIVCTPDHKFLTEGGKWLRADCLAGRRLLSVTPSKSFSASAIIAVALISSARACDFIAWCGNTITARYLTDSTFIMSTKTGAETGLTTSSCSACPNISAESTARRAGSAGESEAFRLLRPRPRNGMAARAAESGTSDTGPSPLARLWLSASRRLARCAGSLTRRAALLLSARGSAIPTAKRVRCESVVLLRERRAVYCMATKEGLLSVQGGVIASNCDALRYGCMSRPMITEAPITPDSVEKILTASAKGPTFQRLIEQRMRAQQGDVW